MFNSTDHNDRSGKILTMKQLTPISSFIPHSHHQLFDGQGEVKVWDLLRHQQAGNFKSALWCELEAKGSVGEHFQKEFSEIIIGIQGQGYAQLGYENYSIAPGICIYLPQGQILKIVNDQSQPLTYLIIKATAE